PSPITDIDCGCPPATDQLTKLTIATETNDLIVSMR
ncbi:MAG: hypothetical protein FD188_3498, partial [Ignavibacteria bacterium]